MENNKKKIKEIVKKLINERFNQSESLFNSILDKINKDGVEKLTIDEKTYLEQHSNNRVDKDLENWLLSDDDETFDIDGNKLLYDQFTDDEDIFYNHNKLKRVITKILDSNPYSNNADWGGGFAWQLGTNVYLFLGDDELVVLKRVEDETSGEVEDTVLLDIDNVKSLNKMFLNYMKHR